MLVGTHPRADDGQEGIYPSLDQCDDGIPDHVEEPLTH
jgi:hypothetical protein